MWHSENYKCDTNVELIIHQDQRLAQIKDFRKIRLTLEKTLVRDKKLLKDRVDQFYFQVVRVTLLNRKVCKHFYTNYRKTLIV